jgi:hypothetical protein
MVAGLVLRQQARSLKPPSGVTAIGFADFELSFHFSCNDRRRRFEKDPRKAKILSFLNYVAFLANRPSFS